MPPKAIRLIFASVLILLLLGWLTGCLFIPSTPRVFGGKDIRGMLGDENSRRPIRIHRITRTQVIASLGDGDDVFSHYLGFPVNHNKHYLRYSWTTEHGKWIGLCYPGYWRGEDTPRTTYIASLEFDEHDVLDAYAIDVYYSDATGYRETRVPPEGKESK